MNNANMYLKNEEAKIKFKAIFNKNADDYSFAGVEHISMVAEYGLHTGDLKESISLVDLHINIQEQYAKAGYHIDDLAVKDMIVRAIGRK